MPSSDHYIICPHCGNSYEYDGEWKPGEHECCECENFFELEFEVIYTTRKLPTPPPAPMVSIANPDEPIRLYDALGSEPNTTPNLVQNGGAE